MEHDLPQENSPQAQKRSEPSLHRMAWPDMLTNLHVAYAELTRTQAELERRMTEINEIRDLFERVIESMSEALFLVDTVGRVMKVNRSSCVLLEREEAELLGKPFVEVCAIADTPATPWQLLARAPSGVLPRMDSELRTHTGHIIPISLSCSLVRDQRGKITGVLLIVRDITERKRAEEVLHRAHDLLETRVQKRTAELTRANEALHREIAERKAAEQRLIQSERLTAVEELAAGIAHAIRNPLTALSIAANLLIKKGIMIGTEQSALLKIIQREMKRLDGILTAFLQFARPRQPHLAPWNINTLCMQVLDVLQHHEASQGKTIHTVFVAQLPPVWIDAEQIKQVLWNLALNGLQAMEEGGTLTISATRQNDKILLMIQDTGHSIPQEEHEKIFTPFYSRKRGGSGLGLSIVRRVVEAHHGRIIVKSEVPRGTTFVIALPLQIEEPSGEVPTQD